MDDITSQMGGHYTRLHFNPLLSLSLPVSRGVLQKGAEERCSDHLIKLHHPAFSFYPVRIGGGRVMQDGARVRIPSFQPSSQDWPVI